LIDIDIVLRLCVSAKIVLGRYWILAEEIYIYIYKYIHRLQVQEPTTDVSAYPALFGMIGFISTLWPFIITRSESEDDTIHVCIASPSNISKS
jgi:hypothetical protein